MAIPEGVTLAFLPPYSPELQPVERVWGLVDAAVANRAWETLDALQEAIVRRCRALREQHDLIRQRTCYHWWPSFA